MSHQVKHPATYSKPILGVLSEIVREAQEQKGDIVVLDPFAGTGKIHQLAGHGITTRGIEIEPEWAAMHPDTEVGNALALPYGPGSVDLVVTSPTYGNRLADHHNAQDGSVRRSYTHDLGRQLHPDNSGQLHFGKKNERYEEFHRRAWGEVYRVLKSDGWFVLNISDFISRGKVQNVVRWHLDHLVWNGWVVRQDHRVETQRLRMGANNKARVDHERVIVLTKEKR